MKTLTRRHLWVVLAAALGAQSGVRGAVTVATIGTPSFDLVDAHLFAAPTDVFPSLFPEHVPTRVVHDPPYDQELSNGLASTGHLDSGSFTVAEFSSPSAVHLGFVLVPNANAPNGTSFDFVNGPIISDDVLPISIQGDVYLNGAPYELGAFSLSLAPSSSHYVVDVWENSEFAPSGLQSLVGDYEYRLALRDVNNVGYDVSAQFQAVPEPISLSPLALGSLAWAGVVWRRKFAPSRRQSQSVVRLP